MWDLGLYQICSANELVTEVTQPEMDFVPSACPLAEDSIFVHAEDMPRTAALGTLTKLLDQSSRPIYVVDGERRIVYCNPALAEWLDLETSRIVGRTVEYHSERAGGSGVEPGAESPLTELCPPPRALFGEPCLGTISCLARGGSLIHRRAEFVPLDPPPNEIDMERNPRRRSAAGVLVLVAGNEMTPAELSSTVSGDPPADELHRTIRQFRRSQAAAYAVESLLGDSAAMRKVRTQVAAAAMSGANCIIYGPRGSGRGHVARAVYYHANTDPAARLIPIDCTLANDDNLRRALHSEATQPGDVRNRSTVVLENLECLAAEYQARLLSAVRQGTFPARVVATTCSRYAPRDAAKSPTTANQLEIDDGNGRGKNTRTTLDPALTDALSTIAIHIPPLAERMEDLPLLAQFFLESCNQGSGKQIGSVRRDALDLLALYRWPGELDELRSVVSAAHRACRTAQIGPADLPPLVHHAAQAASHPPRPAERIILDEMLLTIEKEAIARALAAARGNKSEAAQLLGMTRPRLYRRLVQLGLVAEPLFSELESPEFIEQDPAENTP
jgi:DNA-binding NtrC family response regulator